MDTKEKIMNRRTFLKTAGVSALAAMFLPKWSFGTSKFQTDSLTVWSCGGLAEAFMEANAVYEKQQGITINYMGAQAGALSKSILGGVKAPHVFGGRGMATAKTLKKAGKLTAFRPLCFTEFVIVTPLDNPAKIQSIEDFANPGVQLILPLRAANPGSGGAKGVIKNSGLQKEIMKNMIENETCVVKMMPKIISGKGHASIVERRLVTMENYKGKVNVIPIDPKLFPPGPIPFTIGPMDTVTDPALAEDYISFICSPEGQQAFENNGFISAYSEKGKALVEKMGVKDE